MPLLDATHFDDLPNRRPRPFILGGRALVLVRVDAQVFALEDACPQDGYPLSGGEFVDDTLRCERHGGRFEVATGKCVRDGEDARRYHVRFDNGRVLVQVDDTLPEIEQARLVASLRLALIADDRPRLARDCVRLLNAGAEPADVLRAAMRYGAERSPDGFSSALAACADLARIYPLYARRTRALPLTQALVCVAAANKGKHQRPIPDPKRGVIAGSAESRLLAFLTRMDARDAVEAEAWLSGALYQGLAASEAQQWILAAACHEVVDGGATLVHALKALDLCDLLGMREAMHALPPLVPPLAYGLRAARLPGPVRAVVELLEQNAGSLENVLQRPPSNEPFDDRPLRQVVRDGSPAAAFDALYGALSAGVPARRVALAVVFAAAERALKFDDVAEWDDASEATWQRAVAPFEYAVAALKAVDRWSSPRTVRAIFFAAALVQAARGLESLPEEREPSALRSNPPPVKGGGPRLVMPRALPVGPKADEAVVAVLEAVRGRRSIEAAGLSRGFVERGFDPWGLFEALARDVVEDGVPTQEWLQLGASVVIAAVDAWEAAKEHPDAVVLPVLATRVVAADARERFVSRWVARALALVHGGPARTAQDPADEDQTQADG